MSEEESTLKVTIEKKNADKKPFIKDDVQRDIYLKSEKDKEKTSKKKVDTGIQYKKGIKDEKQRIKILQNPKLLLELIKEIKKEGVVGEENTILALINKVTLRLVKNSDPASSNLLISDETGGGKDYVTSCTCKVLLPEKKYFHRTDISDKAFDYWQPIIKWEEDEKGKKYPVKDSWDGYVIHFEDPREEALEGQSFKTMASGGNWVTKVVKHQAKDIRIEGKPVLIVTSLKTMINVEGCRRWDAIRIDTSKELTRAITKQRLKKATGKFKPKLNQELRNAIQSLEVKDVVIPYAEALTEHLSDNLVQRTQVNKLCDFIKASAVLHQFDRVKQDGLIIANSFDYDYGKFVFEQLKCAEGIALNVDEELFMSVLRNHPNPLSVKEIATDYDRHGIMWIYRHLDAFKTKGLIKEINEHDANANKNICKLYPSDAFQVKGLPNWDVVLTGFNKVLTKPYKEGYNGFNGFNKIVMKIEENRNEIGLIITRLYDKTDNLIKPSEKAQDKTKIKRVKTKQKTIKNAEKEQKKKKTQIKTMNEIKDYVAKVVKSSKGVSLPALYDNFKSSYVTQCLESNLLIKHPKNKDQYVWNERS